ncbi:MAG TPA: hybrid sensor histidine kinase/response regulator [Verrucomicrobiae bacterium]
MKSTNNNAERPVTHEAQADMAGGAKHRRTLLIVDDDESPRQALCMVFGDDYELLIAENGERALELARNHVVDTAIVDIRMPGVSGIDVLAGLKQMDMAIEVIILTAYQTLETARQALRLGARDYLVKPFGVDEIRKVVSAAMEHRNAAGRIKETARLLNSLQEEIEGQRKTVRSSQMKGELYAGIIHDLNSPLTVVSGMAEMMGERLSGVTFVNGEQLAAMRKDVAQLSKHVERCLEISRRYMDLFRQRAHSEKEAYLGSVLKNVDELLSFHPAVKKHELEIVNSAGNVMLPVNALDLEQVLINLIHNALTCTARHHHVWVHARMENENLSADKLESSHGAKVVNEERFLNKGPFVVIEVRDNGVGIPEAVLGRIFQPYFSVREAGQGTGLGLSVVRHLISETQALLRVESHYGHGAIFTLTIPCTPASLLPE